MGKADESADFDLGEAIKQLFAEHGPTIAAAAATHHAERNEKARAYTAAWRAARPEKVYVYTARQRAGRLLRTPPWADTPEERAAIAAVYKEARRRTRETGIKYVVDHFYPLVGRTVSGLHVAANLRVVTAEHNGRKGDKHPDLFSES